MIRKKRLNVLMAIALALFIGVIVGCDSKDEKANAAKPVMAPGSETAGSTDAAPSAKSAAELKADDAGVAVEVDGAKLTKAQVNEEMTKRLSRMEAQIPADRLEQVKSEIKKGMIDGFINRTLLIREVEKKKLTATEEEVASFMNEWKSQLPPGVTVDEFAKQQGLDAAKMRDDIAMSIGIKKLIAQELGAKVKIVDKEISDFYEKNRDKFKKPEMVHARHILVERSPQDTEKVLKDKRDKAEDLRKQLLGGADFAELAKKHSDCPTKQYGGDIGTFTRGQMVKSFEDAAFSQKKNAIGPIVESDFGFHIIQVLDHQASQMAKLDQNTRKQIKAHLENQKDQEVLNQILQKLKTTAHIVVYGT